MDSVPFFVHRWFSFLWIRLSYVIISQRSLLLFICMFHIFSNLDFTTWIVQDEESFSCIILFVILCLVYNIIVSACNYDFEIMLYVRVLNLNCDIWFSSLCLVFNIIVWSCNYDLQIILYSKVQNLNFENLRWAHWWLAPFDFRFKSDRVERLVWTLSNLDFTIWIVQDEESFSCIIYLWSYV